MKWVRISAYRIRNCGVYEGFRQICKVGWGLKFCSRRVEIDQASKAKKRIQQVKACFKNHFAFLRLGLREGRFGTMPEETRTLGARQASNVGLGEGLDQQVPQGTVGNSNLGESARRDPHMRSPEIVARAMLRARERAQNKENIPPEKPSSRRRSQRRGLHSSRSPLPSDYPRAPLQDITSYIEVLQRSRARVRTRMQIHGITPLRQLLVHNSLAQVIHAPVISPQEIGNAAINQMPVSEAPLQETETNITIQGPLLETETTVMHSAVVPKQETQAMGIRGDHPRAKRKSSLKPLMMMR